MRGVLHGSLSLALAIAIALAAKQHPVLALALLGKLCNYGSSAFFHLYPFHTIAGETLAYTMDIAAVPLSVVGMSLPFLAYSPFSWAANVLVAALVILVNVVCVAKQTRGQIGLKPPPDAWSDAPRSVVVGLYTIYVLGLAGVATGFSAPWQLHCLSALCVAYLIDGVNKEHENEPTSSWALHHRSAVWSLHEDMHLMLAVADAAWLAMAVHVL